MAGPPCIMAMTFRSTPPREGRLFAFRVECNPFTVSIHAPTRGATGDVGADVGCFNVSIHAPTRGATNLLRSEALALKVSIHAPTRGATCR